jgi:hypothetical protein
MNTNTRSPNSSGDELDKVMTAYFRAEMPAKWPPAPRPWAEAARPASSPAADPTTRSRWALAASVALLIGSVWYLSGKGTDGQRRPDTNFDGTADTKHAKEAGKDKTKVP